MQKAVESAQVADITQIWTAQKVQVLLADDLDGSEAKETVTF